jgi:hypothetical protein
LLSLPVSKPFGGYAAVKGNLSGTAISKAAIDQPEHLHAGRLSFRASEQGVHTGSQPIPGRAQVYQNSSASAGAGAAPSPSQSRPPAHAAPASQTLLTQQLPESHVQGRTHHMPQRSVAGDSTYVDLQVGSALLQGLQADRYSPLGWHWEDRSLPDCTQGIKHNTLQGEEAMRCEYQSFMVSGDVCNLKERNVLHLPMPGTCKVKLHVQSIQ